MCTAEFYLMPKNPPCRDPANHSHFVRMFPCKTKHMRRALGSTNGFSVWVLLADVTQGADSHYDFRFLQEDALKQCFAYSRRSFEATRFAEEKHEFISAAVGTRKTRDRAMVWKRSCPLCEGGNTVEKADGTVLDVGIQKPVTLVVGREKIDLRWTRRFMCGGGDSWLWNLRSGCLSYRESLR
ncbi:hypothetical protein BU16DRAFT_597292 [Lophium mytilinum]|uniref:Uncharacterized protein n=1 Tax=Lophium mytilinum TaxID=390894 RepID=A0A6A6QCN8_9PEZI|nr:hypothetical protein BU16DRAFT_597292 [Lophium mytilinum]